MRTELKLISAFLVGVATGAGAMYIYKKKNPEVVTVTEYLTFPKKVTEEDAKEVSRKVKEHLEKMADKAEEKLEEIKEEVAGKIDYKKYSDISKGYKVTEEGLKELKTHFEEGKHIADKEPEVETEPVEENEDEDIEIVSNDGFVLDSNDFDYYGVTRFTDDVYMDEYSEVLEDIDDHIGKKAHETLKDGKTEFTVKNYLKGNLYEITQEDQTYEEFLEMTRAMRDDD